MKKKIIEESKRFRFSEGKIFIEVKIDYKHKNFTIYNRFGYDEFKFKKLSESKVVNYLISEVLDFVTNEINK